MHRCYSLFLLLGRVMLALIFVFAGVGKFMDPESSLAYMQSKGFENSALLLYVVAVMELLGGILLIVGYKTRFGALILILALVPITVMMHNFWALEGAAKQEEMLHFFSNTAIIGGLLYVLSCGGGSCGFDKACCPAKE